MFLLENQIPWLVLEALAEFMFVDEHRFVHDMGLRRGVATAAAALEGTGVGVAEKGCRANRGGSRSSGRCAAVVRANLNYTREHGQGHAGESYGRWWCY